MVLGGMCLSPGPIWRGFFLCIGIWEGSSASPGRIKFGTASVEAIVLEGAVGEDVTSPQLPRLWFKISLELLQPCDGELNLEQENDPTMSRLTLS